jgi:hypothetical protein
VVVRNQDDYNSTQHLLPGSHLDNPLNSGYREEKRPQWMGARHSLALVNPSSPHKLREKAWPATRPAMMSSG